MLHDMLRYGEQYRSVQCLIFTRKQKQILICRRIPEIKIKKKKVDDESYFYVMALRLTLNRFFPPLFVSSVNTSFVRSFVHMNKFCHPVPYSVSSFQNIQIYEYNECTMYVFLHRFNDHWSHWSASKAYTKQINIKNSGKIQPTHKCENK